MIQTLLVGLSDVILIFVTLTMQFLYLNPADPRFYNKKAIVYSFRFFISMTALGCMWQLFDVINALFNSGHVFYQSTALFMVGFTGLFVTALIFHIATIKIHSR